MEVLLKYKLLPVKDVIYKGDPVLVKIESTGCITASGNG